MPVMDGFEFKEAFELEYGDRGTLVVALSAVSEDQFKENNRSGMFEEFIEKPVKKMELERLVQRVL